MISDDADRYDEDGRAEPSSWEPQDLASVLNGTHEILEPTMLTRTDGISLLYPGLVHSFHGESESGKSLIVQWLAVLLILAGHDVLYVDHESDKASVVQRLLDLGATAEAIIDHFHYVHPEAGLRSLWDRAAWEVLLARSFTLAVIDGVTDSLGLLGYSTQDNDDIAAWMRLLPKPLAAHTGAAVALIDHVTKDSETRGRFAIGGQAKLAGLTGAGYTVEVTSPLAREEVGEVVLRVAKDRPGFVRAHGATMRKDRTQEIARITVDSTGPTILVTVNPPKVWGQASDTEEEEHWRPTHLMEALSRFVELSDSPLSRNAVLGGIGGKKPYKVKALQALVEEGYLSVEVKGNRHLHRSLKPYRESTDPRMGPDGSQPGPEQVPGPGFANGSPGPRANYKPGTRDPIATTQEADGSHPNGSHPDLCSQHGGGRVPSLCEECRGIEERRAAS